MVEMNGLPRGAGAPFGGYRQSGNGREGGVWGIEEFLEVKSVSGWNEVPAEGLWRDNPVVAGDPHTFHARRTLASRLAPLILAALLVAACGSASNAELLADQIDTIEVPADTGSVMIVLIEPDGTVAYASAGADPAGTAPRPSDIFRIGSITKVFTAVVTLTLVDEGHVDLDAPAADYLTRVELVDKMTVRDLLQHTSGVQNLPADVGHYVDLIEDPDRILTPEDILATVRGPELDFDPGTRFQYSNSNFIILGILIEEVTGRPAAEVLRKRILDPLELSDTYLSGSEPGPPPFDSYTNLLGYSGPIDFDMTAVDGFHWMAGAMVSSAADLHKFFTALVAGELITPALYAEMIDAERYGLGIGTDGLGSNDELIGHNGGLIGYRTLALHSPRTGRTGFWVTAGDGLEWDRTVDAVAARLVG